MAGSSSDICSVCGESLDPRDALREVTGWEQRRKQGGANKIVRRRTTGLLAHTWCIQKPGQRTLI